MSPVRLYFSAQSPQLMRSVSVLAGLLLALWKCIIGHHWIPAVVTGCMVDCIHLIQRSQTGCGFVQMPVFVTTSFIIVQFVLRGVFESRSCLHWLLLCCIYRYQKVATIATSCPCDPPLLPTMTSDFLGRPPWRHTAVIWVRRILTRRSNMFSIFELVVRGSVMTLILAASSATWGTADVCNHRRDLSSGRGTQNIIRWMTLEQTTMTTLRRRYGVTRWPMFLVPDISAAAAAMLVDLSSINLQLRATMTGRWSSGAVTRTTFRRILIVPDWLRHAACGTLSIIRVTFRVTPGGRRRTTTAVLWRHNLDDSTVGTDVVCKSIKMAVTVVTWPHRCASKRLGSLIGLNRINE